MARKSAICHIQKLSAVLPGATIANTQKQLHVFSHLIEESRNIAQQGQRLVEKMIASPAESIPQVLVPSLKINEQFFRMTFLNCEDIQYRELQVAGQPSLLIYLSGMLNLERLEQLIDHLQRMKKSAEIALLSSLYLPAASTTSLIDTAKAVSGIMEGRALLCIDEHPSALLIDLRDPAKRSVEAAVRETVLRGPYEAFNETLGDNIVLIRRRSEDPQIKTRYFSVGERTKTRIAIMYAENLAKPALITELEQRITAVRTDKILSAGTLEEFLIESPWSPFPQTQLTERPDKAAAALYEGRAAILVDNTPGVMLVPASYNYLMQSPEDYTTQPLVASLIRLTRHICTLISVFLPGAYIAITAYHPGILPSSLALTVAELRARAPFPAFLEAAIMEIILEIFQEAVARMPQKLVVAASVVGGFVIGTTVVEAGIINPLLVVVVATTAIASYTVPAYPLSLGFRWLRIPVIVLSAIFGLYGLIIGGLFILTHMYALRSFGESFLGDLFNPTMLQDWKDSLIRLPYRLLRVRPKQFGAKDRMRVGDFDD